MLLFIGQAKIELLTTNCDTVLRLGMLLINETIWVQKDFLSVSNIGYYVLHMTRFAWMQAKGN